MLAEKLKKQFTCSEENTEKYITFAVPIEKEVARIDKNGEITRNISLTCYNLFIAHDLWQSRYQILSIVILKEVTELNVNLDMTVF